MACISNAVHRRTELMEQKKLHALRGRDAYTIQRQNEIRAVETAVGSE
jgi:hypothetical protein